MKTFTKKTIIIFAMLFVSLINQAQTVEWINTYTVNAPTSFAVETDAAGNAYSTGSFQGPGVFGSFSLTTTGTSGWSDIFITKTNPSGSILWAKKVGSKNTDYPQAISVSASGVYVAGVFNDTLVCGTNTLITTPSPFGTPFICKLDLLGNFVWAKQYKVTQISSICIDGTGNLFATGSFTGTAIFGTFTTTSAGSDDAFIGQVDASGNTIGFNKIGGTSSEKGNAIKVDASGNAYIGGQFTGTALFGAVALTSSGSTDAFVAKVNSGGSVIWAKQYGGIGVDGIASISVNSANNIYVGGLYTSPSNIGSNVFTSGNSFVCQLDNAGAVLWANQFGGTSASNYADINSITSDASGNVYSVGYFQGNVTFGSSTISAAFLSSPTKDAFISKLNSSGNFVWIKGYGSTNSNDDANSICEIGGNLYVTGLIAGTGATVDNFTVTSGLYLMKLSTNPMGVKENYKNINLSVYPNPVKDKLVIESEEFSQNLQVSVTDLLGKEVLNKNFINSKTETLDVSMLLPGVYFLKVTVNGQNAVKKFVKE
jgi:hypothetical protein